MFFSSNLIKFRRLYSPLFNSQRLYRYYLVLPEIPKCTSENNELLKAVETGDFPPISSVSFEHAVEATAKLALEFECFSTVHGNSFKDVRKEKTFGTVIEPLNSLNTALECAWGTLKQKYVTNCTPTADGTVNMRVSRIGMIRLLSRVRHVQLNNEHLYRAVKEVAADNLNEWQKRLCERFLLEGQLNGMEFDKPINKLKLDEYWKLYRKQTYDFWLNVKQSSVQSESILNSNDLLGTPKNLLDRWSTNRHDLFEIPSDEDGYASSMTYCRNRMKRFKMWEYWNLRASFAENVPLLNNALFVTEMRETRHEQAKLLGFKTYSQKAIVAKMAYSLDELEEFLTLLREKASVKFQRRLKEMQTFASMTEMVMDNLKPWDYYYYGRLLAENEMRFNQDEFAKYFPFAETWNNLLNITERLFDVRFVYVTDNEIERVHESVAIYCVVDKKTGDKKGYLHFDPFCRAGKNASIWTDVGRTRDKTLNYLPIVYLNADVIQDEQLLYFEQLITIVKSFGTALCNLLCEAPYFDIYGSASVERDGSFVFGEVMKWLVLEPTVLHALSGQKLSLNDAAKARQFYVESSLPFLLRETFLSEYDLTIHNTTTFWLDIWKEMHKSYYLKPMEKKDCYPCSFMNIMIDDGAGAFYSRLWSDMIACDIVTAFREAGFQNETALSAVGKKYRDTYLNFGGGRHARDVFKMFRNRDLEFKHMIKFYNLE